MSIKQRKRQGRAHASATCLLLCCTANGPVCFVDDLFGKLWRLWLPGTGPELFDLGAQALNDDFGCHLAGNVTRSMSANAVGNHGNAEFAVGGDGVFVKRADASGIRQADNLKGMVIGFQGP